MSERSRRLLEAMGRLSDSMVDQAVGKPPRRRLPRGAWAALAACLALAIGAAAILPQLGGRSGQSGGSGSEGTTFMSYAGPVFPLTLKQARQDITARREITLDFSPWQPVWVEGGEDGFWRQGTDILVTDTYTLANSGAEDAQLTLLYPFVAEPMELERLTPALTCDGAALETALHAGGYAGGFMGAGFTSADAEEEGSLNLLQPESWEGYRDLLADGSYLAAALGDTPDLSAVPVTVYRFTHPYSPPEDEGAGVPNPSIQAGFDLDYDSTTILTYGFHAGHYDREGGSMIQGFSIPQPGERGYGTDEYDLVVVGQDIANLTTGGYVTGGADRDTPALEGCGVTVERYESDLETELRRLFALCANDRLEGEEDPADPELWYRCFIQQLLSHGVLSPQTASRYDTGRIEDIAADVLALRRVCWLEAAVTVPAGGRVAVSAQLTKQGSYDYYCAHTEKQGLYGYDLVTALGSNLSFTGQSAVLEDRGLIEIVEQNFGFDLAAGVREVELDAAVEHYYFIVRRAVTEEPVPT